jgi:hypothetical protein
MGNLFVRRSQEVQGTQQMEQQNGKSVEKVGKARSLSYNKILV